jgi:hypothetical protein
MFIEAKEEILSCSCLILLLLLRLSLFSLCLFQASKFLLLMDPLDIW